MLSTFIAHVSSFGFFMREIATQTSCHRRQPLLPG
jgi:hypothetical protein